MIWLLIDYYKRDKINVFSLYNIKRDLLQLLVIIFEIRH